MHEEPGLDLSHLLPSVQAQARRPAEERIRHVRTDRWIGRNAKDSALNGQVIPAKQPEALAAK